MIVVAFLAAALAAPPPAGVAVAAPDDNGGLNLDVTWEPVPGATGFAVLRADIEAGPLDGGRGSLPPDKTEISDQVSTDPRKDPPEERYLYKVVALDAASPAPPVLEADEAKADAGRAAYAAALASSAGARPPSRAVPRRRSSSRRPGTRSSSA